MTKTGVLFLTLGEAQTISDEATSVNPEFRNADIHVLCLPTPSVENEESDIRLFQQYNAGIYQFGSGMYPNEAEIFHSLDWKTEYWGSMERYNKLLQIKNIWDPNNIFTCFHCVGSDNIYNYNELPPLDENSSCTCPNI